MVAQERGKNMYTQEQIDEALRIANYAGLPADGLPLDTRDAVTVPAWAYRNKPATYAE